MGEDRLKLCRFDRVHEVVRQLVGAGKVGVEVEGVEVEIRVLKQ